MPGFLRSAQGRALLSDAPFGELLARAGTTTPAYFYDLDGIGRETADLVQALGAERHLVAYAVKANSAGSIMRAVARQGAGADVVSGGELDVALGSGMAPGRIVMSGVAKSDAEIDRAVQVGLRAVQLESVEEIERVAARARALGRTARVSLRVNPGVEIDAHAHVATGHDEAKFGIARSDVAEAWRAIDRAGRALEAVGVSTHVGSMLKTPEPYLESARVACDVARARLAAGARLEFVDFGGGFGIDYGGGPARPPADFARAALELLEREGLADLDLVLEPGRALVGAYGVLVARVVQGKVSGARRWAMIDAGMNDLVRPALYGARHRIEPLDAPPAEPRWQVVGPVCESADDFGVHALGDPLPSHVAIRDAGAYGFSMASEYNGRPLPAEVFCANGGVQSVSPSPGASEWVKRRLNA